MTRYARAETSCAVAVPLDNQRRTHPDGHLGLSKVSGGVGGCLELDSRVPRY
jgi:hypothetical protein